MRCTKVALMRITEGKNSDDTKKKKRDEIYDRADHVDVKF